MKLQNIVNNLDLGGAPLCSLVPLPIDLGERRCLLFCTQESGDWEVLEVHHGAPVDPHDNLWDGLESGEKINTGTINELVTSNQFFTIFGFTTRVV